MMAITPTEKTSDQVYTIYYSENGGEAICRVHDANQNGVLDASDQTLCATNTKDNFIARNHISLGKPEVSLKIRGLGSGVWRAPLAELAAKSKRDFLDKLPDNDPEAVWSQIDDLKALRSKLYSDKVFYGMGFLQPSDQINSKAKGTFENSLRETLQELDDMVETLQGRLAGILSKKSPAEFKDFCEKLARARDNISLAKALGAWIGQYSHQEEYVSIVPDLFSSAIHSARFSTLVKLGLANSRFVFEGRFPQSFDWLLTLFNSKDERVRHQAAASYSLLNWIDPKPSIDSHLDASLKAAYDAHIKKVAISYFSNQEPIYDITNSFDDDINYYLKRDIAVALLQEARFQQAGNEAWIWRCFGSHIFLSQIPRFKIEWQKKIIEQIKQADVLDPKIKSLLVTRLEICVFGQKTPDKGQTQSLDKLFNSLYTALETSRGTEKMSELLASEYVKMKSYNREASQSFYEKYLRH